MKLIFVCRVHWTVRILPRGAFCRCMWSRTCISRHTKYQGLRTVNKIHFAAICIIKEYDFLDESPDHVLPFFYFIFETRLNGLNVVYIKVVHNP